MNRLLRTIGIVAGIAGGAFAFATTATAQLRVPGGDRPALPRAGSGASPSGGAQATPAPSSGGARRVILLDRIVAVVGKEVITMRELEERLGLVAKQLEAADVPRPQRELLERQVLERLINDRAQLQFARESGVRVDDLQLDRAVARIAENNKMSLAEFRRALERDNVPYEKLREDVRTEITLSRLREREVDSKIQVTDGEIDEFLAAEKKTPAAEITEYDVSHILVRVPENAASVQVERLQQRARDALKELRSGKTFAEVAASYSDAPDGLKGGNLGFRTRERLPELFVEAVDGMKPGDTSEVLRSPAGFHIVRLVEQRGVSADAPQVEQWRARHILVKTNEIVSDTEARRKINLLRERIVQGQDFAEVAKLNSDDGSAARGGDLGWLFPGDTVPEFENAMRQLDDRKVSEPVRSPFGWHLIEVLEKRKGDLTSDRKRFAARRALRERKAEEAYEEWLRQLRDRTYVEYRLDER